MFRALIRLLVHLYGIFWVLIIMVSLGVVACWTWHSYQAERRYNQFRAEGRPVTIRIDHTDRERREVWDALSNFVYLGFTYRNQRYETRFVNDTQWLSEGGRVGLLYHPGWNAFEQPQPTLASNQTRVVSRLINWSVVSDFSLEYQLLGGFIMIALALFFFGGSVLVKLTGWTLVQTIARFVLVITLGAVALFFTYDVIQYHWYVNEVRTNGRNLDVVVGDTDRTTYGRTNRYIYQATFPFQGQERVVPIEEADYERINSGDNRLTVRYAKALDDFVPVDYSPDWYRLIAPAFFWLIFILIIRNDSNNK